MNRFKRTGLLAYVSAAVILLALVGGPSAAWPLELGCVPVTKADIAKLFVNWNNALQRSNPNNPGPVVDLYASDAVLLPTVETGPYTNHADIAKYFVHFLEKKPSGRIDESRRSIHLGCNMAFDAGLYTFTYDACPQPPKPPDPKCPASVAARYTYVYEYVGDKWPIVHHHSSVDPQRPPPRPQPQ